MTVPAAKVSSICTASEVALVRASRKPELNQLTVSQLKRMVVRARKLFDKWQGQGRAQARVKSQQVGSGTVAERTQLKTLVFADALQSFEARLTQLSAEPAASAAKTKPKAKKAARAASHRATRAGVRKSLAGQK